jgi:FkbM family methyltransferase
MIKEYRGPLAWYRRWNFKRVERRRWFRELFAAIPANDAVLLEGVTRLLERSAEEADRRVAWQATVDQKLEALAGQMESRHATVNQRLDALGGQLVVEQAAVDLKLDALAALAEARQATLDQKLDALVGLTEVLPATIHQKLDTLGDQLTECLRRLAPAPDPGEPTAPDAFPVIPTARLRLLDPELDLLLGLAPWLTPKTAIDVGAHHGVFSEALLEAGFEVHALEPNPTTFEELVRRLGSRPGFKAHQLAAGASDGEADLGLVQDPTGNYIDPSQFASLSGLSPPPGLVSIGAVRVKVRRLDSLVRDQEVPLPSFVKVDAEGMDLEVMRGLGALRPSLLQLEFWDEDMPFSGPGATNRVPGLVELARQYGMPWHLVVFRRWGDDRAAFYSGRSGSPELSWGNVYFFSDHSLYERARKILEVTLPEARFVSTRQP